MPIKMVAMPVSACIDCDSITSLRSGFRLDRQLHREDNMSTTAMTSRFRVRASVAGAALFGIGLIGAVPASADTITFETIPNHGTPYEGQVISDQYWSQWGIKFKMGDGSNPVIAKVGGPGQGENTTALVPL